MPHTHGCPKCGTITVHHCTGRNAGAPDCPPCCEYDLDGGEFGNFCDDCYEQAINAEQRADATDEAYEAIETHQPQAAEIMHNLLRFLGGHHA